MVHAVSNFTLSVEHGETLGFVGETGAGKTTTALGILRILPEPPSKITGGEILFEGVNLLNKTPDEMRKVRGKEIAMIFQDPMTSLDPVITVSKQIQEMILLHENISSREAVEKAEAMLEVVGIKKERANDYPHQFSGGMKQRVVIAIALACNPKLLIADEPTTALDVTIQAQVLELMKELKNKYNMSMIMITHDLGIVAEICDKVAIMYAGNIVEYGTAEQIYEAHRHPYTQALFNSIPSIDTEMKTLSVIPGLPPDPTDLPPGCLFHPRCKYFDKECVTAAPENIEVKPGHFVRCVKMAGNKAEGIFKGKHSDE
ncbi:MAG: ABC transporter ATP-binding protein [Synergistaceae bacterium]|nr:ABC transporter ATP-binding protein [Synergistaceae bacterium]